MLQGVKLKGSVVGCSLHTPGCVFLDLRFLASLEEGLELAIFVENRLMRKKFDVFDMVVGFVFTIFLLFGVARVYALEDTEASETETQCT